MHISRLTRSRLIIDGASRRIFYELFSPNASDRSRRDGVFISPSAIYTSPKKFPGFQATTKRRVKLRSTCVGRSHKGRCQESVRPIERFNQSPGNYPGTATVRPTFSITRVYVRTFVRACARTHKNLIILFPRVREKRDGTNNGTISEPRECFSVCIWYLLAGEWTTLEYL